MDSDVEESDDDMFDPGTVYIDRSPFLGECQDESKGIESFYKCFEQRYDACPVFFSGSLRDACESAFNSNVIKERRPVLVYIHNDNSMFNNVFCYSIFCSTTIIDYLLENYIVWPWDATLESNKTILKQVWKDIFSTELLDDFCVENCPMLIGIMRFFVENKNGSFTSEYQFKSLLKGDVLTRTQGKSNREAVLNELAIFKEKCDDNEQALSFDFINNTGFCWEIILEIIKYLSLKEAITAFSGNILPMLQKYKTKIHISDPSDAFIKMVRRKINLEQIVSLQLNTIQSYYTTELCPLRMFTNVTTLILLNLQHMTTISEYTIYFPMLNCLSLWYDSEVNFHLSISILQNMRSSMKRFEIHCAASVCSHYFTNHFYSGSRRNMAIEYFLLDVAQHPFLTVDKCYGQHNTCLLMTIIDFMKYMQNIRYVRLVTNKYNLHRLLDVNEWKSLALNCDRLKKMTLRVMGIMVQDEPLMKKILDIQNELYNIRQTIKFEVLFA